MRTATEPFTQRFMDASELNRLLLHSQLKQGADLKILMYYATAVPMGEPVRKTATDIGKLVGLSTTSASRSIGRLATQDWLQHAYTAVGIKFYRLGPKATAPNIEDNTQQNLAVVHHIFPTRQGEWED
ncbi:hypothetical protein C3489_19020 [Streptomyces sp. Ru71]|uniref:hypothetical protein n=1 Tax=Streptomyces sp. Ru71 TaxID=2080746 RepID=UPI000D454A47|nr:hypothetical protein [Streptomyces sp. Ru71]POX52039.1 hypothetical protein C3489_19020 [Streptomyces sp. Ru71]